MPTSTRSVAALERLALDGARVITTIETTGEAELLPTLIVVFGHTPGECANPANVACSLGHTNCMSSIQKIKRMRRLEYLFVSR